MENASLSFDKRRHPRLQLEIPVKYKLVNKSEEVLALMEHKRAVQTGASKDLSAQGLFLVSEQRLAQGDILKIYVHLPEEELPVCAFTEVIWSSDSGLPAGKHGSGLSFMALRDEDQQRMRQFVDKALAQEMA
jgi:hypothetical protein